MAPLAKAFAASWSDFGPDAIEAQGDFNRPWLLSSFGTEYLPLIPDVHQRLLADPPAHVADFACGVGWASVAIAAAYPKVIVHGFDLDESSIEIAPQDLETFSARHASLHGGHP